MPRTISEVNKDYTMECAKLGDLIFRREQLEKDITEQTFLVARLNKEAAGAIRSPLVDKAAEPLTDKTE